MANPQNLAPPFDGTKRGPGRPKGTVSLRSRLKGHLERHPEDADVIVLKVIKDAQEGDVQARKLVFEQVDGAVKQKLAISGDTEAMFGVLADELRKHGVDEDTARAVLVGVMEALSRS